MQHCAVNMQHAALLCKDSRWPRRTQLCCTEATHLRAARSLLYQEAEIALLCCGPALTGAGQQTAEGALLLREGMSKAVCTSFLCTSAEPAALLCCDYGSSAL